MHLKACVIDILKGAKKHKSIWAQPGSDQEFRKRKKKPSNSDISSAQTVTTEELIFAISPCHQTAEFFGVLVRFSELKST